MEIGSPKGRCRSAVTKPNDPHARGGVEARRKQLRRTALDRLEARYDPRERLVWAADPDVRLHDPRGSLAYAVLLLEGARSEGDPEAVRSAALEAEHASQRARLILDRLLDLQVGAEGPHAGNFPWMAEDQEVTDLNAAPFMLHGLSYVVHRHAEWVEGSLQERLERCFRSGLQELRRLDVSLRYTNIALLDMADRILGGEWLPDGDGYAAEGYARLRQLATMVQEAGDAVEYNSPTYSAVQLRALESITRFARDEAGRGTARSVGQRIWENLAARLHLPTAQLAGPHARAYHRELLGGPSSVKLLLYVLHGDGRFLAESPYFGHGGEDATDEAWVSLQAIPSFPFGDPDLPYQLPLPRQVRVTSDPVEGEYATTYMTTRYALGTASVNRSCVANQTTTLSVYYETERAPGFNVLYCKYLTNDHTIASFYHGSARRRFTNLLDEGLFHGLQNGSQAIALYGVRPLQESVHSLKLDVYLQDARRLSAVYLGRDPCPGYPDIPAEGIALRPEQSAVFVQDGPLYLAIVPLHATRLSRRTPRLVHLNESGELVLSLYNYLGPSQPLWTYGRFAETAAFDNPFYHANLQNGFAIEVADSDEFSSFEAFRRCIEKAHITETVDEGGTRHTVRYESRGRTLTVSRDLYSNRLIEARVDGRIVEPPRGPVLESVTFPPHAP